MAPHLMRPPWSVHRHWHRQRGVALLLTLLILTAVSLLGVSALRASLFGARMATGTEIDAMAFAAAESAIDATLSALKNNPERLRSLLAGNTLTQCVTLANPGKAGACASGDHLDFRALVVAESHARRVGYRPVASGSIGVDSDETAPLVVEYRIAILGEATIAHFGRHEHHMQIVVVRGPKPATETPIPGAGLTALHRSGWHPVTEADAKAFLASEGGG